MPPVAKTPANLVDFDAARSKKKKSTARPFHAFGKNWKVKRANFHWFARWEEEQTASSAFGFILAHIDKSQRDDFVEAFSADEDMDMEMTLELMAAVQEAAYPEVPSTPS